MKGLELEQKKETPDKERRLFVWTAQEMQSSPLIAQEPIQK